MVDNNLLKIHKKAAARRVAAKYSCHLDMATHKYMERSGLLKEAPEEFQSKLKHHFDGLHSDLEAVIQEYPSYEIPDDFYQYGWEITHAEPFISAQKEMLDLLRGYRHPVKNILMEHEIFFGDTGIQFGEPVSFPNWSRNDKDFLNLPKPLRQEIYNYIDEAEDNKRHLSYARKTIARLQGLLDNARENHLPTCDGENSDKRARRVVAGLGLSKGTRKKEYTDHEVYALYVYLVRRKGKPRQDAVKSVAESFSRAPNTILDSLNSIIAKEKKKRPVYNNYLKKLVPFKGDWEL